MEEAIAANPTFRFSSRSPLLFLARHRGVVEMKLLLEGGAFVDSRDSHGLTPLLWACRSGDLAVARLLVEHGADVDLQNEYGESALMTSAGSCWPAGNEIMELLLERGASVGLLNNHGDSALSLAAESGNVAAVQLLLGRGAPLHGHENAESVLQLARRGKQAD